MGRQRMVCLFPLLVSACVHRNFSEPASRNSEITRDPAVVFIMGSQGDGSGVVVGGNTLLTVNHVVETPNPRSLKAVPNFDPTRAFETLSIAGLHVFDRDPRREIAVGVLEGASLPGYPIWTGGLAETQRGVFHAKGFGITADVHDQRGKMRRADLVLKGFCSVKSLDETPACATGGFPRVEGSIPMVEFGPGPSNSMVCAGDSGGPVFIEFNGRTFLFGLMSHVLTPEGVRTSTAEEHCAQGEVVRVIPVSPYLAWVRENTPDRTLAVSHPGNSGLTGETGPTAPQPPPPVAPVRPTVGNPGDFLQQEFAVRVKLSSGSLDLREAAELSNALIRRGIPNLIVKTSELIYLATKGHPSSSEAFRQGDDIVALREGDLDAGFFRGRKITAYPYQTSMDCPQFQSAEQDGVRFFLCGQN